MVNRLQPISVTDAAIERVKTMLATRVEPAFGVRIGVRARGCSGYSYTMDFADAVAPGDEVIEANGVKILIDAKASMFIFGTVMDFVDDTMSSGFVFRNPNEKGRCGCGESFTV